MANQFEERVRSLFRASLLDLDSQIDSVLRQQSARYMLASGNTVQLVLHKCNSSTLDTVTACADALARNVQTRGKRWRTGVSIIRKELEKHYVEINLLLDSKSDVAGIDFRKTGHQLHQDLNAKSAAHIYDIEWGWGAPEIKPWAVRHPIFTGCLLAVIGAAAAILFQMFEKIIINYF